MLENQGLLLLIEVSVLSAAMQGKSGNITVNNDTEALNLSRFQVFSIL